MRISLIHSYIWKLDEPVRGANVKDPYLWLENLKDNRVIEWYLTRNKRARKFLRPISKKLKPRIEWYYSIPYVLLVRTSKLGNFILLRDGETFKIKLIHLDGHVDELIDSRKLGRDVVLQWIYVSEEGDRFAFSYSIGGSDEGFLKVMDTKSLEVLDELKGVIGEIVWLNKEKYYFARFYAKEKTPDGVAPPAERIFLRENGKEEMIFGHGLPSAYFIGMKKSFEANRVLLTVSYGWTKSDVYAGRIEKPESWRLLYGGGNFITFPIDFVDGKYFLASFDMKGMGRILSVEDKGQTKEIVSEHMYPLQEAVATKDSIIANYLTNASSKLKIFDLNGKKIKEIKPEPAGTIDSLHSDGEKCIFKYESFYIPYRIYLLKDKKLKILDSKEITEGFKVDEFYVKSKDSTKIHAFKVQKKDSMCKFALVYGYGGFGISLTPKFYPFIIPFLEDGGTLVVANLRGGKEYGEKWHRAGMLEKKQNVFDDFIAILEFLKSKDVKTVAFGVSNGGLLVGAILTQRPELIDGALIGYPVLDMLRFHKLYIGKAWVPEYGDPDKPEDAAFLMKYSPYHNIVKRKYPPVMLYTGLHDDRVHPAHAFKFTAKLEEVGAFCLLRVETKSGHSGATPQTKIEEYSDMMAFVYTVLFEQDNLTNI